jgi:hypothetical protein
MEETPLDKLPAAKVFDRDPEDWHKEEWAQWKERAKALITEAVQRARKARGIKDEAPSTEQ